VAAESVSGRPLRVFVSSAMLELKDERQAIKSALRDLKVDAWVYEDDAGARDQTTRTTYLEELDAADLYIGVFWKRFGAYTIDEYRHAVSTQKPTLLFVKKAGERDAPLQAFLGEVGDVEQGRATRWFDTAEELREFIKDDVARWQASLVRRYTESAFTGPFQVEPLSDQYVERPEVLRAARTLWLPDAPQSPPVVTRAAFHGLGGSGKSVMARAFAHDEAVRRAFPDGVLWVTLERDEGQPIDFPRLQSAWGRALRDPAMPSVGYPDRTSGSAQLRSLLQSKACLLIVDDVWDAEHVRPFLVGGPRCLLLITTRKREVVDAVGATAIELSSMTADEAFALIEQWCGPVAGEDRKLASELAAEVGFLPLALGLMAAQARALGWTEYRDRWRAQRLGALRRGRRGTGRDHNVLDSLELSVSGLGEDAELYAQLAVFGANTAFPPSAAAALWDLHLRDAEDLLLDLAGQALLTRTSEQGTARYSLHSLLHEYVFNRVGPAMPDMHARLIDGYRKRGPAGWHQVPDDGYFAGRLTYHLAAAGRLEDVQALIDKPWMDAQFARAMSHGPFLADLRTALQTARREPPNLPAAVRVTVISIVLTALAGDDPDSMLTALVEAGEEQLALSRAAAQPQSYQRVAGYIAIAEALRTRGQHAEARQAAQQALLAAESMAASEPQAAGRLAKAAACLARCGAFAQDSLASATSAARALPTDWTSEQVDTLATIAGGYLSLGDDIAAHAAFQSIIEIIEASTAEEALWLFSKPAETLADGGPIEVLYRLRDLGLDLLRQGIDSYVLMNTAKALAARGDIDAGLALVARLRSSRVEVLSAVAMSAMRAGDRKKALALLEQGIAEAQESLRNNDAALSSTGLLIELAGHLDRVDLVTALYGTGGDTDPVWHAWFLSSLARAHALAGSADPIPSLASDAVRRLRAALHEKELHGEAVRAESAGYLAEAGAIEAALAIADDIADSNYQKVALAAIARQLLVRDRNEEARTLLRRTLAIGEPPRLNQLMGITHAARGLARVGRCDAAVSALQSILSELDSIDRSDYSAEARMAAIGSFQSCGQTDLARTVASQLLESLVADQPVTDERALRSDALLCASGAAPDAFDRALAVTTQWFYRRAIPRAVAKACVDQGDPQRAIAFVDALEAEKHQYPPWNERPRLDALSRLFEAADADIRRWVLDVVTTFQSTESRAILRARAAACLAADRDTAAADLARSAIDAAEHAAESEQDSLFAEMVSIYSAQGMTDFVVACAERIKNVNQRNFSLGTAAVSFAARDDTAAVTYILGLIDAEPARNSWIESVAQTLFDRRQYGAAQDVLAMLTLSRDFARDFAAAKTADAFARADDLQAASEAFERVFATAQAHVDDSDYGLVFADLSLCAARLKRMDAARELAEHAQRHAAAWGPFVSACLAATYTLLNDASQAESAAQQTAAALVAADDSNAGPQAAGCARTWVEAGLTRLEPLVDRVNAIGDPYQRASAISGFAATARTLPGATWNRLLSEASAIPDFWASVQALRGLVAPAAAAGQRPILQKIFEIASAFDNNWARGDVLSALAASYDAHGDDDLLERILAVASDWRMTRWVAVTILAQSASTLSRRQQHQRSRPLVERAADAAKTALETDLVELAGYDAELAMAYLALGREDTAHAVIGRVLSTAAHVIRDYQRNSLRDVLERLAGDVTLLSILQSMAAVSASAQTGSRPDAHISLVSFIARRMATLGHGEAALELLNTVTSPDMPPPRDTDVRLQLAHALLVVGRRQDAIRMFFDAAEKAGAEPIWGQPAIYRTLVDTLVAVNEPGALLSMLNTLRALDTWWQPRATSPGTTGN
jgi:hypothetical protein